jgi:aldehyde:ferredoxin oxidoreductase
MGYGYLGRVLVVDLAKRTASVRSVREEVFRRYWGGSGLGIALLREMGDPGIDPYDPRNPLIFAPGLLTGTTLPGVTRTSVCAKSPLTGIFGEATVGGTWGAELRFCGFDAVVFTGAASSPVYLWLQNDAAEIRPAERLWGKDTYAVNDLVQAETDPRARVAAIGAAGENRVKYAAVMFEGDLGRAAGRTGMGAVMGAKRLKAVAVKGSRGIPVKDPKALLAWNARVTMDLGSKFGLFAKYGTTTAVELHEERGALGIKNWAAAAFTEGARRIGGKAIERRYAVKQSSCNACPTHCWVVLKDPKDGAARPGRGPEYETLGSLGAMVMLDDLEAVVKANALANRHGMDTISLGNTIAFAIEAFEKGLLTERDTGGLRLAWGDGNLVVKLVELIARREGPLGDLLAEGSLAAARRLGRGAEDLTVQVKGLEFPMHDPRAFWSSALNYAAGSRGACHLDAMAFVVESGVPLPEFGYNSKLSPHSADAKAELVQRMHDLMGLYNALGLCKFWVRHSIGPVWLAEAVGLVTGWKLTPQEAMETGDRIFTAKRLFNVAAGVTRKDDTIPPRITGLDRNEKVRHVPPEAFQRMLDEYYRLREWDPEGRPRPERLERLGIRAVEPVLAG